MRDVAAAPTLRPATVADLAVIASLDAASSPDPFGLSHLDRYCTGTAGCAALLAIRESEPLAFALYSLVLDEGSIDNIAVLPQLRGRGFGGYLLDAVLQAMRERGAQRCVLDVRASNTAARALYASRGFGEDGLRRGYYTRDGSSEDAVLMSRRL
ncbi:ribosomal-protein-alanine N-acetyltransferase [Mangrovimicrobium sediminis]|uniref:[Ribosomal protein bS18]-alanine N-acetyltransferase n=1 Tax=Mangrovimicrobium sediminis TaxID=2562682 RepID=A0A4Z0LV58_9GAMM|nr:ribosomal protein S18-alanine N-acetyltransferase [Haliea sp. SAOS-164]TGD71181.1 ribosomal-protein-alanine N-acetyltransferase [Haliea sp. SAOS-164]